VSGVEVERGEVKVSSFGGKAIEGDRFVYIERCIFDSTKPIKINKQTNSGQAIREGPVV